MPIAIKAISPEQTGRTIMFASNNLSNSTNAKEAYKEFDRRYPIPLLNWNNPEEAKARRLVLSQQFHSNCYVDSDVLSRLVDNVCAFEKLYNRYVNSANVTSLDTKDYIGAFMAISNLEEYAQTILPFNQIRVHMPFVVKHCVTETFEMRNELPSDCLDVVETLRSHARPDSNLCTLHELFCNEAWSLDEKDLYELMMDDFSSFLLQTFPARGE